MKKKLIYRRSDFLSYLAFIENEISLIIPEIRNIYSVFNRYMSDENISTKIILEKETLLKNTVNAFVEKITQKALEYPFETIFNELNRINFGEKRTFKLIKLRYLGSNWNGAEWKKKHYTIKFEGLGDSRAYPLFYLFIEADERGKSKHNFSTSHTAYEKLFYFLWYFDASETPSVPKDLHNDKSLILEYLPDRSRIPISLYPPKKIIDTKEYPKPIRKRTHLPEKHYPFVKSFDSSFEMLINKLKPLNKLYISKELDSEFFLNEAGLAFTEFVQGVKRGLFESFARNALARFSIFEEFAPDKNNGFKCLVSMSREKKNTDRGIGIKLDKRNHIRFDVELIFIKKTVKYKIEGYSKKRQTVKKKIGLLSFQSKSGMRTSALSSFPFNEIIFITPPAPNHTFISHTTSRPEITANFLSSALTGLFLMLEQENYYPFFDQFSLGRKTVKQKKIIPIKGRAKSVYHAFLKEIDNGHTELLNKVVHINREYENKFLSPALFLEKSLQIFLEFFQAIFEKIKKLPSSSNDNRLKINFSGKGVDLPFCTFEYYPHHNYPDEKVVEISTLFYHCKYDPKLYEGKTFGVIDYFPNIFPKGFSLSIKPIFSSFLLGVRIDEIRHHIPLTSKVLAERLSDAIAHMVNHLHPEYADKNLLPSLFYLYSNEYKHKSSPKAIRTKEVSNANKDRLREHFVKYNALPLLDLYEIQKILSSIYDKYAKSEEKHYDNNYATLQYQNDIKITESIKPFYTIANDVDNLFSIFMNKWIFSPAFEKGFPLRFFYKFEKELEVSSKEFLWEEKNLKAKISLHREKRDNSIYHKVSVVFYFVVTPSIVIEKDNVIPSVDKVLFTISKDEKETEKNYLKNEKKSQYLLHFSAQTFSILASAGHAIIPIQDDDITELNLTQDTLFQGMKGLTVSHKDLPHKLKE